VRESVSGKKRRVVVLKFKPGRLRDFLERREESSLTRDSNSGVARPSCVVVLKFRPGLLNAFL
jgi:hypothetical protein